jgi:hypothetical protein
MEPIDVKGDVLGLPLLLDHDFFRRALNEHSGRSGYRVLGLSLCPGFLKKTITKTPSLLVLWLWESASRNQFQGEANRRVMMRKIE